MKKLLLLVAFLAFAGVVRADDEATFSIRVTPQGTKGVSIAPLEWNLGTRNLGTQNIISTTAFVISNVGSVPTTYSLEVTNGASPWTPGAASAIDTYHVQTLFNSVPVNFLAFADGDDDLTLNPKTASATFFAGNETGVAVGAGVDRNLWLNFDMPSGTTVETERVIEVTVVAN